MLFVVFVVLFVLYAWRELWPPADINQAALGHLLFNTSWITYDPSGIWLNKDREPVYPDIKQIKRELDLIKKAGFSGVYISTSNDIMSQVPRLKKQRSLNVILGIWDASKRAEISRAIRESDFVDAYYVGSNGLTDRYSLNDLRDGIFLVKQRTRRPAAISELASRYDSKLTFCAHPLETVKIMQCVFSNSLKYPVF